MTSDHDTTRLLDRLLTEGEARWRLWHTEHAALTDADMYVALMGELIETLLPASDAQLQSLAVDPRVWTHRHGLDTDTVRASVQAALTSLIANHLDTTKS